MFERKAYKAGPIAIDMGSHRVRLLQLTDGAGGRALHARACLEPSPPVAPAPGDTQVPCRQLLQASAALRTGGFRGRRVVLGLRPADVRIKTFRLPPMPAAELEKAVRFEAIERFQTLDAEPELRFITAGRVDSSDGEALELIVMAVRHDLLESLLTTAMEQKLEVVGVELGALSMFNAFERFLQREADRELVNAFLDLGHSGTRIVIARGADVLLIKTVDLGARQMRQALADRFGVDLHRAEALHETANASGAVGAQGIQPEASPRQVYECIEPLVHQLGREIALCLKYASITFKGARSSSLTCVGGLAGDEKILDWLAADTGLPARAGHPWRGIRMQAALPPTSSGRGVDLDPDAPNGDWAAALGLALSGSAARVSKEILVSEAVA